MHRNGAQEREGGASSMHARPYRRARPRRLRALASLGLLTAVAGAAQAGAEEWRVIGARYQGMGGAGVAVAEGASAAHWNPGALAFAPPLLEVDMTLGLAAAAEGDFLANTKQLLEFVDRSGFETTLDKIERGQQLGPTELANAIRLLTRELGGFAGGGQGAIATADAGLLLRRGRWVLTSRATALAGVAPVLDTTGLRLRPDALADLGNLIGPGGEHSAAFGNPGSQSLADALAALADDLTQAQAEELVLQAERAGVDTSDPGVRGLLSALAQSDASDRLNQTGGVALGVYTKEFGLASGFQVGESLGIGAHVRHVHATTVYKSILLSDPATRDVGTSDRRRSTAVALDVGVLYTPLPGLRLGVAARNLNRPRFDTRGPDPYELEPQVRLGVALELTPRLSIAADVDLTRNAFETLDGVESRMLAVGMRYTARLFERSLELRAGAHRNTASGPNSDIALTLGVGFYSGSFQFDLSLGSALERRRLDGLDAHLPERLDVAASVRWVTEF